MEIKLLITGGAGFIGSNLVEKYLNDERIALVRVVDDLSNGYYENIEEFVGHPKFEFLKGDICDFSVGLARQLYGLTMHSERPNHRMYEQWHPLGVVGIISAFNFPVAVWSWNSMIAAVCGDVSIWKPSEKTPLSAIACFNVMQKVLKANNLPEGIFNLIIGDVPEIGEKLIADPRIPLVAQPSPGQVVVLGTISGQ